VNVVILGSPGVGKGTYAKILSEKYNIPRISSGDLFREAIRDETELGKKIEDYVSRGDLVPDEITIELVKERLERDDCENGFFIDGFPRTITQAEALEKFKKIDKVLNFVASEWVILSRLGGRRTCRKCGAIYHIKEIPPKVEGICDLCGGKLYQRSDETPQAIKNRLRVYREKTKPVLDYFRRRGLLADIDANYQFEEISKVISQCEKHLQKFGAGLRK
jgi:adenylate kinase